MLRRLIYSALLASFCLLTVEDVGTSAGSSQSTAPSQPKHGLIGSYYVSTLETHSDTRPGDPWFVQVWFDPNDFQLPKPLTAPAAVRVDAQIAFGNSKGFVMRDNKRFPWTPTGYAVPAGWNDPRTKPWEYQGGTIWKGFIHLPKAGTYYLSTVSNGASVVYLNKARVALNGIFGGVLVSDAFSYNKDDVRDYVQYVAAGREDVALTAHPEYRYVVPVTVDGPRDLPIEVRYNSWVKANQGSGIDLFWVTPDSPRDSNGKPIAQIVPPDALYIEAPSQIATAAMRSANSMVSADFLYFPTEYIDKFVAVTVRLADKDGNPVAGKRVYVYSLASYGNADAIVQPEKPTDENGETTAELQAGGGYKVAHESTIFATDVTDLVDVAQVAHVTFQDVPNSFFPDSFSPYYDNGKFFSIDPLPLIEGRPVTVRITLQNRGKFAAEVTATFFANDWNIGAVAWNQIGKESGIRLQPGEAKEVKTTWTPGKSTHQCFKAEVSGRYLVKSGHATAILEATFVPSMMRGPELARMAAVANVIQRNIGGVADCTFSPPPESRAGPSSPEEFMSYGTWDVGQELARNCKPNQQQKDWCKHAGAMWQATADKDYALEGRPDKIEQLQADLYLKCYGDPPDSSYQHLAVASSETSAAYIEAMTKSMERYQGAQVEGDGEWMARHATAMELYEKRLAEALRRDAEEFQKRADQLPPDDPSAVAAMQKASDERFARLRRGYSLTPDELNVLRQAGFSDEAIKAFVSRLTALKEVPPVRGPRGRLLDRANLYRQTANEAERLAGAPLTLGNGDREQRFLQFYVVGNPHERQEKVDLLIRPVSIPSDWKLSLANAEQAERSSQAGAGDPSRFSVQVIEPGKHYAVTLPPKGEVKVASVLIPVGELGARTTARWAVEGRIGDELIGGMVHEMNVPYFIADLKLPPVGSKEEEEMEQPVSRKTSRLVLVAVVAALSILAILVLFIFWRRHRRAATP